MARRFLFSIVALFLFTAPAHADLAAGLDAIKRGDWATALKELKPLADKGDPVAMRELSVMYFAGNGVPKDQATGRQLLKAAADKGDAEAQGRFALQLLIDGAAGNAKAFEEAARYNQRAAQQGNAIGLMGLALQYGAGLGVPVDTVKGFEFIKRAADLGTPEAMDLTADAYERGVGVARSDAQAKIYRERALAALPADSPLRGEYQQKLNSVSQRIAAEIVGGEMQRAMLAYEAKGYATALPLLKQVAESGDAAAQHIVGSMYEQGQGTPVDVTQAAAWYRRGVAQKHANSAIALAVLFARGQGVPEDIREARRLMRMGIAGKPPQEQARLWTIYDSLYLFENGDVSPVMGNYVGAINRRDIEGAERDLRHAAEAGSRVANWLLGNVILQGVEAGRPSNSALTISSAEGMAALNRSAERGFAPAQGALGKQYAVGRHVPKDVKESLRWYRMAADQDEPTSAISLASAYESGTGVERNVQEAIKWYRVAAKSSSPGRIRGESEAALTRLLTQQ